MAWLCLTTAAAAIWSSGIEPFDRRYVGYIPPLDHADLPALPEPRQCCCHAISRLIATAVLYAWLYNSSGGGLFLVMVAHAAYDITVPVMPEVGGGPIFVALSEVAVP